MALNYEESIKNYHYLNKRLGRVSVLTTREGYCGLRAMHAFSIIDAFPLYNEDQKDKIDYNILIIREPFGP